MIDKKILPLNKRGFGVEGVQFEVWNDRYDFMLLKLKDGSYVSYEGPGFAMDNDSGVPYADEKAAKTAFMKHVEQTPKYYGFDEEEWTPRNGYSYSFFAYADGKNYATCEYWKVCDQYGVGSIFAAMAHWLEVDCEDDFHWFDHYDYVHPWVQKNIFGKKPEFEVMPGMCMVVRYKHVMCENPHSDEEVIFYGKKELQLADDYNQLIGCSFVPEQLGLKPVYPYNKEKGPWPKPGDVNQHVITDIFHPHHMDYDYAYEDPKGRTPAQFRAQWYQKRGSSVGPDLVKLFGEEPPKKPEPPEPVYANEAERLCGKEIKI